MQKQHTCKSIHVRSRIKSANNRFSFQMNSLLSSHGGGCLQKQPGKRSSPRGSPANTAARPSPVGQRRPRGHVPGPILLLGPAGLLLPPKGFFSPWKRGRAKRGLGPCSGALPGAPALSASAPVGPTGRVSTGLPGRAQQTLCPHHS